MRSVRIHVGAHEHKGCAAEVERCQLLVPVMIDLDGVLGAGSDIEAAKLDCVAAGSFEARVGVVDSSLFHGKHS